jgi:hypothetical protein
MLFPVMFFQHPPSGQWESLPIARLPGVVLWAWFRPAHLPSGVVVSIPPELLTAFSAGFPMTMADVLTAAGIPPQQFQAISLFGSEWQSSAIFAQVVNHPIPPVPTGCSPEISIAVAEQQAMIPMMPALPMYHPGIDPSMAMAAFSGQLAYPVPPSGEFGEDFVDDYEFVDDEPALTEDMMYKRVEAAWKSARQIERQMTGLRKRLSSIQDALGKLDRDLLPEERLASSREDRDEWTEARRWVRELQTRCHREIKAFDIGTTSGAGARRRLEEIYQTMIEPRIAGGQLETYRTEFEKFRKGTVSLQRAMVTALQTASQNGTQRAQRVLGKIAVKIRELRAKNREPLGGTNIDGSVRRKG